MREPMALRKSLDHSSEIQDHTRDGLSDITASYGRQGICRLNGCKDLGSTDKNRRRPKLLNFGITPAENLADRCCRLERAGSSVIIAQVENQHSAFATCTPLRR